MLGDKFDDNIIYADSLVLLPNSVITNSTDVRQIQKDNLSFRYSNYELAGKLLHYK